MPDEANEPNTSSSEPAAKTSAAAEQAVRAYFGVAPSKLEAERKIRQILAGALWAAVLLPALTYLQFGTIGLMGWVLIAGFEVFILLVALGVYLVYRPEYHTKVATRGDWLDRVGAFWLVAIGFGPLLGWLVTSSVFSVTLTSWRWQYAIRVALSVGLPVLTGFPLLRYARGKAAMIALPLLIGLTALPVLSGSWTLRDLLDGPVVREAQIAKGYVGKVVMLDNQPLNFSLDAYPWAKPGNTVIITWLPHTGRVINLAPTLQ
jgi:hypothetical protein